jgi:hypothetical protein
MYNYFGDVWELTVIGKILKYPRNIVNSVQPTWKKKTSPVLFIHCMISLPSRSSATMDRQASFRKYTSHFEEASIPCPTALCCQAAFQCEKSDINKLHRSVFFVGPFMETRNFIN